MQTLKKSTKLNGWQRIGIIFSIAWIIGIFIYINNGEAKLAAEVGNLAYLHCMSATNQVDAKKCLDTQLIEEQNYYKQTYQEKNYRFYFIEAVMIPIFVGWILIYLIIFIIRWIKSGTFRSGTI